MMVENWEGMFPGYTKINTNLKILWLYRNVQEMRSMTTKNKCLPKEDKKEIK